MNSIHDISKKVRMLNKNLVLKNDPNIRPSNKKFNAVEPIVISKFRNKKLKEKNNESYENKVLFQKNYNCSLDSSFNPRLKLFEDKIIEPQKRFNSSDDKNQIKISRKFDCIKSEQIINRLNFKEVNEKYSSDSLELNPKKPLFGPPKIPTNSESKATIEKNFFKQDTVLLTKNRKKSGEEKKKIPKLVCNFINKDLIQKNIGINQKVINKDLIDQYKKNLFFKKKHDNYSLDLENFDKSEIQHNFEISKQNDSLREYQSDDEVSISQISSPVGNAQIIKAKSIQGFEMSDDISSIKHDQNRLESIQVIYSSTQNENYTGLSSDSGNYKYSLNK